METLTLTSLLNIFHATGPFLYPLKTLENIWFSYAFKGSKKTSGMKWVDRRETLLKGILNFMNFTNKFL